MSFHFILGTFFAGVAVSAIQAAVSPHPDRCTLYYDTSAPAQSAYWEDHLQECPSPLVFNADTSRCEHYTTVDCGDRKAPEWPCDYKITECMTSHCIPCSVHALDCRGLPDGPNVRHGREDSPFYVVCKDERAVYDGRCKRGLFNAATLECDCLYPGQYDDPY